MALEHSLSQTASLDSLQRYYRVPAHRRPARPHVLMILTRIIMHIIKRSANAQKDPLLSPQAVLAARNLVDITRRTRGGASAGVTVYQLRVRVDQVALDHRARTDITGDIITNIATEIASSAKKWSKQLEFIELPSSIRIRWNRETPGEAEIQPNETSHAYADCAIAVALAESALIAQIHHIIPNQPPSRCLVDAYLMYLT
ncbi:MAG: hypothetical protein EZS28_048072, partial [Streblomastix strix]